MNVAVDIVKGKVLASQLFLQLDSLSKCNQLILEGLIRTMPQLTERNQLM